MGTECSFGCDKSVQPNWKEKQRYQTYPDLSNKNIGLFFLDSKISGYGQVKHGVIIVDISDDYVHSSSRCLKEE